MTSEALSRRAVLSAPVRTGGQYSLYRVLFGAYLFLHFAQLLAYGTELFSAAGVLPTAAASPFFSSVPNLFWISDSPTFVSAVLWAGVVSSVLFAIGWRDRAAALLLWCIWSALFVRNPLISNPSLPFIGLLLVVHVALPAGKRAPYGAWSMRGRVDPGGGWGMPPELVRVVWILMSVGYSYSGFTKLLSPSWRDGSALARVLNNPLARLGSLGSLLLDLPPFILRISTWGALGFELAFAFLVLSRKLRPVAWGMMLAMHISLIFLIDFADLSLGMVILHLFTFDPAWIPGRRAEAPETVFYDGECGLCHRTVRFLLAEDSTGELFSFAPLQGSTFEARIPRSERANLPDSIFLQRADGRLLCSSAAIVHLMIGLGGAWGLVGRGLRIVPPALRDLGYRSVAAVRKRIFAKPEGLCPMLPPHLGSRFLP